MANKRCVNVAVVNDADFLKLSPTAQCLYFHILLNCDDDGFSNNAIIECRKIGCNENVLKELVDSELILQSGKIYIIKHWWLHNTYRADTYVKSVYADKVKLYIKENKAYTLRKGKDTCLYQFRSKNATQIKENKIKINKEKLNKDNKEINNKENDNVVVDDDYSIPFVWGAKEQEKAVMLKLAQQNGATLTAKQQAYIKCYDKENS